MNESKIEPWGTYAPAGVGKLLLLGSRLGLGRGPVKKVINRRWLKRYPRVPVDIAYHGVKFRLHPWDNTIESKMLFSSKQRERQELNTMKKFVAAGGVFIDIGANIGYYSLMAANFGASRILSIDPNPVTYSRLMFNISANGFDDRISALPVALGNRSDKATLLIAAEGDMGGSRIGDLEASERSAEVVMRPLFSVLNDEKIDHIDALKIDVEGMEDLILSPFYKDAPTSMWPKLVIMEHTSQQQWKNNIMSWMLEANYKLIGKTRSNAMLQFF